MKSVDIELAHVVKGVDVLQAAQRIAEAIQESTGAVSSDILTIKSKRVDENIILHEIMLQPLCGLCVFLTNKVPSSDTFQQEIDENGFLSFIRISYAENHPGSPYTDRQEDEAIKEIADRLHTILNRQLPV